MKNGIIQHKSTFEKLCYFILICIISKFLFMFISVYLSSIIFNVDLINSTDSINLNNINTIRAYKLASFIDQIGAFLIPVILFAKLISENPNELWFFSKINKQQVILILPIFFIIVTISFLLLIFNHSIDLSFLSPEIESEINNTQKSIDNIHNAFIGHSYKSYLLNIFVIAIVPAFCEELVFRGLLQNLFSKWMKNLHFGILLSALLFALLHFQFYNFSALIFIGIVFGYTVALSGNIWITIIIHFMFNFYSLTKIYLIKTGVIENFNWVNKIGFTQIIITILCIFFVYFKLKNNNKLAETKSLYIK